MAVQFSKAFGQNCTVISRSYKKKDLALELGADRYVATEDAACVSEASGTLDVIIDTIGAPHDMDVLLRMLKVRELPRAILELRISTLFQ
jgi:alcohol dehydrogenase (NADP+)